MKTLVLLTLLFFNPGCTLLKSQGTFSSFDFLPNSTQEAVTNGFLRMKKRSLKNLPFSEFLNISSTYQRHTSDTIVQLFFDDEKLVARALVFPFKKFDSSDLITNLRKLGEVILHDKSVKGSLIGAFRNGSDVYYILETSIAIALINRPGVDITTRPTGPIIEPVRKQ